MQLEALDGIGLHGSEAAESLDLRVKDFVLSLERHIVQMYLLVEGVVLSAKAVQVRGGLRHLLLHLLLDALLDKSQDGFVHVVKSTWCCDCGLCCR